MPLILDDDRKYVEDKLGSLTSSHPIEIHEQRIIDQDGHIRWQQWTNRAIVNENHQLIEYQAVGRDITDQKKAEEQILASLVEKEALLKEVHHRVKNNLQVIASLLSLQANNTAASETRAALVESQGRVRSMALLHQLLYEHQSFAHVDLGDYLRELARHAITSTEVVNVNVEFDLTPLKLDLHRAVPCGLLVNELLTNACKHAFPDGRAGTVRLELRVSREDGTALLVISDNGVGMPEGFELGEPKSLGLQLIPLLAEQFGGELNVKQGIGTRYDLRFRFAA